MKSVKQRARWRLPKNGGSRHTSCESERTRAVAQWLPTLNETESPVAPEGFAASGSSRAVEPSQVVQGKAFAPMGIAIRSSRIHDLARSPRAESRSGGRFGCAVDGACSALVEGLEISGGCLLRNRQQPLGPLRGVERDHLEARQQRTIGAQKLRCTRSRWVSKRDASQAVASITRVSERAEFRPGQGREVPGERTPAGN